MVSDPKKSVSFYDFVLNCGWVGVKSPKLFSENTHNVYMEYNFFLEKIPKDLFLFFL